MAPKDGGACVGKKGSAATHPAVWTRYGRGAATPRRIRLSVRPGGRTRPGHGCPRAPDDDAERAERRHQDGGRKRVRRKVCDLADHHRQQARPPYGLTQVPTAAGACAQPGGGVLGRGGETAMQRQEQGQERQQPGATGCHALVLHTPEWARRYL